MTLEEIFEGLSFGPLANLSIGGNGSGEIPATRHKRILNLVDRGLLDLHKRFNVRENQLVLRALSSVTLYRMNSRYADSSSVSVEESIVKYIDDSDLEPFEDDLIRILTVFDMNGREYPLNDEGVEWSMFTPNPTTLQIPFAQDGQAYSVIYQSRHPKLVFDDLSDESGLDLSTEIDLPDVLLEPLLSWVGSRVYSSMSGQNASNKSQSLQAAYDAACNRIEAEDLVSTSRVMTTYKLRDRGFK